MNTAHSPMDSCCTIPFCLQEATSTKRGRCAIDYCADRGPATCLVAMARLLTDVDFRFKRHVCDSDIYQAEGELKFNSASQGINSSHHSYVMSPIFLHLKACCLLASMIGITKSTSNSGFHKCLGQKPYLSSQFRFRCHYRIMSKPVVNSFLTPYTESPSGVKRTERIRKHTVDDFAIPRIGILASRTISSLKILGSQRRNPGNWDPGTPDDFIPNNLGSQNSNSGNLGS
ncbi:hypothetical protein J6590_062820 [Homalodisca vitripennis]|nr:hypothetical protein J6590_062820 [Homalodisca vitripennis]